MIRLLQSSMLDASLTAALGLAFAAGDARAITEPRSFIQNATGACQSALPAFEGSIRKRPLAIQNDGASSAFVSCSLMGTDRSAAGITVIEVFADNNTANPIDVTCTLITGLSKFGTPQFLTETITVEAHQNNLFGWDSDNNGNPFNNFTVNLSCALPAGTGLSRISVRYDEDVGA